MRPGAGGRDWRGVAALEGPSPFGPPVGIRWAHSLREGFLCSVQSVLATGRQLYKLVSQHLTLSLSPCSAELAKGNDRCWVFLHTGALCFVTKRCFGFLTWTKAGAHLIQHL